MTIREDIKAFIDDELTPERAAEVQAAIDQNPALREEYLFMKQLSGEIQNSAREPVVQGLDKAVAGATKPRYSAPGLKWGGMLAGGLAGLFFLGFLGSKVLPGFSGGQADSAAVATSAAKTASPSGDAVNSFSDPSVPAPVTGKPESLNGASENQVQIRPLDGSPNGGGGNVTAPSPTSATATEAPSEERPQEQTGLDAKSGEIAMNANVRGRDSLEERAVGRTKAKKIEARDSETEKASKAQTSEGGQAFRSSRKVIRNADMAIKVGKVQEALAETERQVTAVGGFVEDTKYNRAEDTSTGTMLFQVPEENFSATVDFLRKLGTVTREDIGGKDVTAEVAHTDGRIKALADEEHNLIAELQRTKNTETRLELRRRLSMVRQDMEGQKESNKVMKDLAAMSRMSVTFNLSGQLDENKPSDWFNQTMTGATELLGFFGRFVGIGVIYAVILAPIWLPIVGVVWYAKKKAALKAKTE